MKVVSWNIENALPRLAALPQIVEQLGAPDVLCLQELRIRCRRHNQLSVDPGKGPGCYDPRLHGLREKE